MSDLILAKADLQSKSECYKLVCFRCNHTVEIPTVGACGCPMCGTALTALDWGALHHEAAGAA
jgi:hypothetical protein